MSQTVVELFEEQVHRSSVRPALRRFHDGIWEEFTWTEWWDLSERVAAGLMECGLAPGDTICVLASTRMEWVIADMAIAMAGAISIPLHAATAPRQLGKVLAENQTTIIIVEDPVQLGKLLEIQDSTPSLTHIIYLDQDVLVESQRGGGEFLRIRSMALPADIEVLSLDATGARGRAALSEDPRFVARRRREIDGDTTATILYTAGVSGDPRGVILTHSNLAAQVEALSALQLFSRDDVQLLFLPLAHIFSRVLYLAAVGYGMLSVFGRGPGRLVDDLAEIQPTLLASVPRVYERLHQELVDRIQQRGVRAHLLPAALEVGKTVSRRTQGGNRVGVFLRWEHRIFSRLLLEDVRQWLGGRMRFLLSGGAPLAKETAEFFFAAGVSLLEGYGLTETSGVVSCNMPDDFRLGSVGRLLPGIDVTIAEDGEILVRGDTVMKGYVGEGEGRQDQRLRAVDQDGWFHTGDIGHFDARGYLFLTDRKRDLIVTSTGKHIVAAPLERALCDHPLIAHAIVLGEGRPYLGALVAVDPDGLLQFVDQNKINGDRPIRQLTADPRVSQELRSHIDRVNKERSTYEHIRKIAVLPVFLSTQNQMLTASGNLRRAEVVQSFEDIVANLFEGGSMESYLLNSGISD